MSNYAIISLGGKQYRVHEGEKLLVDRVSTDEGKTFHPDVLFTGGDGSADFKPKIQVTAVRRKASFERLVQTQRICRSGKSSGGTSLRSTTSQQTCRRL